MAFLDLLMVKASEENSDMSDEVLRNEVSTFMAAVSNCKLIMEIIGLLKYFERYRVSIQQLSPLTGSSISSPSIPISRFIINSNVKAKHTQF